MSIANFISFSPLWILSLTLVILLLLSPFTSDSRMIVSLTGLGFISAFCGLLFESGSPVITSLLVLDSYAIFYLGLILPAAFIVVLFSFNFEKQGHEYYLLLILATLGSEVIVVSHHFASFFLGLEILSVSLYSLISYSRGDSIENPQGIEAGTQYLILAGTTSAFLLFGMALIYASSGAMELTQVGTVWVKTVGKDPLMTVGTALILVGIGFKLALVPFHMWSPDIFESAPAPVTAFIATVSKGALFVFLFRYSLKIDLNLYPALFYSLAILSTGSMFVGNFLALRENNIKRLLAYSSIAHWGYLLIAVLAGNQISANAVALYILAYFITVLMAFGIITVISGPAKEADLLQDYLGMFWKKPFFAVILSLSILSLAGIPMTAGFTGKFYLVTAGVSFALWSLVVILVLNSALGLYYYLRIIVMVFAVPSLTTSSHHLNPHASHTTSQLSGSNFGNSSHRSSVLVLVTLAFLLIGLGIYPSPVLQVIQDSMSTVFR